MQQENRQTIGIGTLQNSNWSTNIKWANDMNRGFTEKLQLVNKHNSITRVKKIYIRTTPRYFSPIKFAEINTAGGSGNYFNQ